MAVKKKKEKKEKDGTLKKGLLNMQFFKYGFNPQPISHFLG